MWYYVVGDKRLGPISLDEIQRLVRAEDIGAATPVWTKGFDGWQSLDSVESLSPLLAEIPPPPPASAPSIDDATAMGALVGTEPLAGAWARFVARTLDRWLMSVALMFAIGIAAVSTPEIFVWLETTNETAVGLVLIPVILLGLAVISAVFGTTIGKALLGIRVRNLSPFGSFRFHLTREMNAKI